MRLNKMNGWQRLWFAGTVLALIIFGLIYPVMERGKNRDFNYRWAIQKDYGNPDCAAFLTLPFDELREPSFDGDGGTCWHIYTTRLYEDNHQAVLTYKAWVSQDDKDYWITVLIFGGLMALVVLFVSAIVYAFGRTIAWIRKGFRPSP